MTSGLITSWQIEGEKGKQGQILFSWDFKITADSDCSHEIKRHLLLGRKSDKPRQCSQKHRFHFASKGLYSQSYGFSSSHVWIHEEG